MSAPLSGSTVTSRCALRNVNACTPGAISLRRAISPLPGPKPCRSWRGRAGNVIELDHVDQSLDVPEGERPTAMSVGRIAHHGRGVVVHYETVEAQVLQFPDDARRLVVALAQEALDEGGHSALDVA